MEALASQKEGNLALGEIMGDELIAQLTGEWRLLYTSSNSMEFNQVCSPRDDEASQSFGFDISCRCVYIDYTRIHCCTGLLFACNLASETGQTRT